MKIRFLFLLIATSVFSQKQITLEEIWQGKFQPNYLEELASTNNGKYYTTIEHLVNSTKVEQYAYATQQKVATLIDTKNFPEIQNFSFYVFSQDESKVLLGVNLEPIYRRSKKGYYYVFNMKNKALQLVSKDKIQAPSFSPDGTKVAYVYNNNLFVKNLNSKKTTQITFDGEKNKIINGITDWVYEEEFAFVQAYEWNKTGSHLAFIKFNETEVPKYSMAIFGTTLYPNEDTFKYPKAGENNSKVSLFVHRLGDNKNTKINLNNPYYIPRIKWTKQANTLSITTLNRHQNNLNLLFYNTDNKQTKTILNEKSDTYVDITDNLIFLKDNSFIWTNEKNDYNHLYHYTSSGKLKKQITKGNWEVTSFYGVNQGTIYYQSSEGNSTERAIYSIDLKGKNKKKLSPQKGTNKAYFSADFSYYINQFSDANTPYMFSLYDTKTLRKLKNLITNNTLKETLKGYTTSPKEFSTITINGYNLNMWQIKPPNFDANKAYPLLLFQYSGPGSQMVSNKWLDSNDLWYQILANKGYIVACVDGRGTGLKGSAFKKMTYKKLGQYEVEDQITVAKTLAKEPYVDNNRIGIWGWSFGGFVSSNCILKGGDIFSMAIAVAPVTSWRFYDTIYTERYMTTPQENPKGYDDNSPINFAKNLQDSFLLIHGSADDNVHFQNSMRMTEALIQANKPFDWAIYPDKNHAIYGGNTRLHLYNKMTNFILKNL